MHELFLYLFECDFLIYLPISSYLSLALIHSDAFSISKKHLYSLALNSSLAAKCWLISSYTFCMHLKFELFITVRHGASLHSWLGFGLFLQGNPAWVCEWRVFGSLLLERKCDLNILR